MNSHWWLLIANSLDPIGAVSRWAAAEQTAAALEQPRSKIAASAAIDDRMPIGFTDQGDPYLGDPGAPVTIIEYSDYLCPFCSRHAQQTLPVLIERYVHQGQLRYVFRNYPIAEIHPTAAQASAAARCVGEQSPALFWQMHHELFRRQSEWSELSDPRDFLAGLAAQVGAGPSAYRNCVKTGYALRAVATQVRTAKALGVNGTPTFRLLRAQSEQTYTLEGAQPLDVFYRWVDALLANRAPPKPGASPAPDIPPLPFWAKPEGLEPDPNRPGFTKAGDPYKGDPAAALAVVEFVDFQCPFGKRHALEIQPAVDQELIARGKIFWVAKNLPPKMHPNALVAAAAGECAAEQGRFWEMYQTLFERQAQWGVADPDLALPPLADAVGVDRDAFERCFLGASRRLPN